MAQSTTGVHSLLSSSTVYRLFQNLMGANGTRANFVRDYVRAQAGNSVLDIGCGPADILDHLPQGTDYWGFDISQRYIDNARSRHGTRGTFFAKELQASDLSDLPPIDVAIATGLFHHLDDVTADTLLGVILCALKPGGRLVTLDGVFERGQNPLARWLISMDRGQHVRTRAEYETLFSKKFSATKIQIQHRGWIPYTYCIAECRCPE